MSQNDAHCQAYLAVHRSERFPGNTIFVIVEDRAAFDLIDLPVTDHGPKESGGHVITKTIEHGLHYMIIFQFWIQKPKP